MHAADQRNVDQQISTAVLKHARIASTSFNTKMVMRSQLHCRSQIHLIIY